MRKYRVPLIFAVLLAIWLAFGSQIIDLINPRLSETEGLPPGVEFEGKLYYTQGFEGIWQLDMQSGAVSRWWQPPEGGLVKGIAASPDGSQFAIAYSPPIEEGFQIGTADLFLSPSAEADLQPLLVRESRNESYHNASWSPDGQWVYFVHQNPLLDDEGGVTGFDLTAERIAVNNESVPVPEVILEGVEQLALSSDGQQIAYLQLDTTTYDQGLWIVNHDGTDKREIVTAGTYRLMSSPVFSPDGKSLIFSASGIPNNTASRDAGVQIARAHGEPWDILQISLDEGISTKLNPTSLDGPWLAWSPQGTALAVLSAEGIYVVYEGQFHRLTDVLGEGEITWSP